MQFLADKVRKLRIGWNRKPLGEADLYRLCRRFRIQVTEMPLRTDGFYYRVKGRDFIAVNSRLDGPMKLLVLFHELGHHIHRRVFPGHGDPEEAAEKWRRILTREVLRQRYRSLAHRAQPIDEGWGKRFAQMHDQEDGSVKALWQNFNKKPAKWFPKFK